MPLVAPDRFEHSGIARSLGEPPGEGAARPERAAVRAAQAQGASSEGAAWRAGGSRAGRGRARWRARRRHHPAALAVAVSTGRASALLAERPALAHVTVWPDIGASEMPACIVASSVS